MTGPLRLLSPLARAGWIGGAATTVVLATAQPIAYHVGVYGADNRPISVAGMVVITVGRTVVAIGGLAAWARRPDSRVGMVLVLWALVSLSSGIGLREHGALLVWSYLSIFVSRALFAWALLTYPDGRTETRCERRFLQGLIAGSLCWLGYVLVTPATELDSSCRTAICPRNPLLLYESTQASLIFWAGQQAISGILAASLLVLLIRRYRRMPPSRRRANAPVLWAATGPIIVFLVKIVLDVTQTQEPSLRSALYWADHATVYWVPIAMIVGLLASRLARADITALLLKLQSASVDELQPSLAAVLGDPRAQIAISVPDPAGGATPGHVDSSGQRLTLPTELASDRIYTDIGDGILLLHHPAACTEDPHLFDAAIAAARLALDNVQLTAQVRAQLAEVKKSRERLVRAGDEERRRLERDLHDGAQQRLIGLGMSLQAVRAAVDDDSPVARMLDEATDQLRHSLIELRDLARGLRPALLAERGLAVAVQTLLHHVPVPTTLVADLPTRPDRAVETAAFFVVAEALQNITRHAPDARATITLSAHDDRLTVTVSDDGPGGADARIGTGLRGIADRVAAVGGHMSISDGDRHGTTITADLPLCR